MSKYSRMGGKFGGNHTTCIPLAARVADIANRLDEVTKISVGFIKAGLKVSNHRRVKITDDGQSVLLSVRDNASLQEIRVYVTSVQDGKLALARGIRDADIAICFRDSAG